VQKSVFLLLRLLWRNHCVLNQWRFYDLKYVKMKSFAFLFIRILDRFGLKKYVKLLFNYVFKKNHAN